MYGPQISPVTLKTPASIPHHHQTPSQEQRSALHTQPPNSFRPLAHPAHQSSFLGTMMSFNSEIDKTMDNLSLVDRTESASEPVSPKKSLLSSSLAQERAAYGFGHPATQNRTYHNPSKALFSLDESDRSGAEPRDAPKGYTDDHPEPELLASSVGKDINGHLIPSSSTISLLSLNNLHNDLDSTLIPVSKDPQTSAKLQSHFSQPYQAQPASQVPPFMDRKNSLTTIPSRNSITHLNQIRLQTYQRLTSPPPAGPQPLVSPQIPYEPYQSTTQSIPINTAYKPNMIVPDSPNLDPTSLGGSPSRFWLSSQTPPRSMASSLNRNSRTYLYQPQHNPNPTSGVQSPSQPQPPSGQAQTPKDSKKTMYISLQPSSNFNYTTATVQPISTSSSTGHDSPNLAPVQTPLEDPPMTPLFLNKLTVENDSYFGNYTSAPSGEYAGKDITSVATLIEEAELEEESSSEENR